MSLSTPPIHSLGPRKIITRDKPRFYELVRLLQELVLYNIETPHLDTPPIVELRKKLQPLLLEILPEATFAVGLMKEKKLEIDKETVVFIDMTLTSRLGTPAQTRVFITYANALEQGNRVVLLLDPVEALKPLGPT